MSNNYPENTHAVFLTNVNGSGDDVMCFTTLDTDTLKKAYDGKLTYDEMYIVPDKDVQYYIYEPCYLTLKEEQRARELAAVKQPS